MRFKCVCKAWKRIIEQDPHFLNLHSIRSDDRPGLFIVSRSGPILSKKKYKIKGSRRHLSLLSLDLHKSGANLHSVKRIESSTPERVEFVGPVRGLVCLIDRVAVRICNVSTGVVTPWFNSIVSTTVRTCTGYPTCLFGFDGRNYKAVFLWREYGPFPPVCEVLTERGEGSTSTSTSSWRIIDSVPPYEQPVQHITACSNGSVYWVTKEYYCNSDRDSDWIPVVYYHEFLVAFDIGSEQFRIITIPKFTRIVDGLPYNLTVIDLDGCPAVLRLDRCTITMWKFHDKESASEEDWSEVTIRQPSYLSIDHIIFFHSIPGKDLLILETYAPTRQPVVVPVMDWRNVKRARFYCYSLKNKTFSEFQVQGISDLRDDCVTHCATLVESLCLLSKHN
ncbi:hypothetical protein LINGRAHAP2_LOCUS10064 [Linum grandiflorum]